jgi:hypothetical protein
MKLDIKILRDYFEQYNEQVRKVPGITGLVEIDISEGLDLIIESVYDLKRLEQQSSLNNNWTCRARNEFCQQVLLYFLYTGKVPDYNVKKIIASAKEELPFPIGKSFEKYTRKLMKKKSPVK